MSASPPYSKAVTAFAFEDLCHYLAEALDESGCDGTLRHAETVFGAEQLPRFRETGGYCDCEVLMNSAPRILDILDHAWLDFGSAPAR